MTRRAWGRTGLAWGLALSVYAAAPAQITTKGVAEDLSGIQRKTKFALGEPELLDRKVTATFVREQWALTWRPLDRVVFYVVKPVGKTRPRVCLYIYTFPQGLDRWRNDEFCARVVGQGVAAVGMESALTGERYRFRPMKEYFISELAEALAKSTHDVSYLIDHLATRKDLDASKVGVFGTGSGGTIGLLAAAADPRVRAVDAINPWGAWPEWVKDTTTFPDSERAAYRKRAYLDRAAAFDPVRWLPRLKGRAVRMQFVKNDLSVPPAARARLVKAAPAGSVVEEYSDNLHHYQAVSGGRMFEWMAERLGR